MLERAIIQKPTPSWIFSAAFLLSKIRKMQAPILRIVKEAPKLFKRNLGIAAPALQKASDPIQQLFIDKLREYKQKSSGGKLVEPSPEMEKELKADLEKVFKQFGGKPGEDLTQFPKLTFAEPQIDPINLQTQQS